MRSGIARLLALACVAAAVTSCDKTPLAPSEYPSLAASAGSSLGAPSNLSSTAVSFSQINLAWQDNASNETGFEVHRSTTGPGGTFTLSAKTGANVTSYTDIGLTAETRYCYKVRAYRTSGLKTHYSAFSSTACDTTPPRAPSNTSATPLNSTWVDVTWADNSGTEDGFRVERSVGSAGPWETVATTGANVTSYRDGGRMSEQQVCYRVIAFNIHGDSGPSNIDCTAPPAGPTNLTAVAASQTIDLAWADNSAVEDGYEVERSDDGVTFSSHARLPANVTRFSDDRPSSNTTYWYRVRALKDGGFSDRSNVASATRTCGDGPERVCDNGVDDDCDGAVDFADPDCTNCPDPTELDCGNYADDDCDGLVDGADPDCPAPECDWGCPPGMVCYPNGFCYYPDYQGEL